MSPTVARSPSPTTRQSKVLPQSDTSDEQELLEPLGREDRHVLAAEPVAQQHVQAVDVDAVVGVPVGEHHRGEVLGRDVLLQVPEGAVAAVDPDRGRRRRAAGSRCTPRRRRRRTTPSTPTPSAPRSAPLPGLDGGDLGTEEPHAERPESIDVAAGEENVPRVTRRRFAASSPVRRQQRRGPRTRSRRHSTPARRPGPSRRRWYGPSRG